jgi:hypothetical protein
MAEGGAHLLLQIRVQEFNEDSHATFKHWYPYLQHRQEGELAAYHIPNFRLLSIRRPACKIHLKTCHSALPYSETPLSRPVAAAALAIPDRAALIFSAVLQRRPRRLPSTGLRDCREVNVEGCQILSSSDACRMPTHQCDIPGRHSDPLRHPLKDWRDASRV